MRTWRAEMKKKCIIGLIVLVACALFAWPYLADAQQDTPPPDTASINKLISKYYYLLPRNTPPSELDAIAELGLKHSEEIGYKRGQAVFLSIIAQRYCAKTEYVTALEYDLRSLKIFEETSDSSGLSPVYNSIGILLAQFQDFPKSIEYFNKCLEFAKYSKDASALASYYTNMASIYQQSDNPDSAIVLFKKAYLAAIETDSRMKAFNALCELAYTSAKYYKQYQYAYGILKQADSLLGNEYPMWRKMEFDMRFGYVLNKMYYPARAAKHLEYAMETAVKENAKAQLIEIVDCLSESYSLLGRYKDAYDIQEKYKGLRDSIFKEVNLNRIAYLNFVYNQAENEREISLLKEKNSKLRTERTLIAFIVAFSIVVIVLLAIAFSIASKRNKEKRESLAVLHEKNLLIEHQNVELEAIIDDLQQKKELILKQNEDLEQANNLLAESNKSKDKFFSILAHDLKNPFQFLLSMTSFLYDNYTVLADEKKVGILKDLNGIVKSTNKLLENLLLWARFQLHNIKVNIEPMNLKNIVVETGMLFNESSSQKGIQVLYELDAEINVKADRFLLSTIIRNLLSNSVKFTNPQGVVSVRTSETDGIVSLCVEDNGVGIEKSRLDTLFRVDAASSTMGTHKEKGSGLGLMLCHDFAKKMGIKIEVASELGRGSCFRLVFTSDSSGRM